MTRLPILTAKRLEKLLLNLGFQRVRQKGSHVLSVTQMVEPPPYHIIAAVISPDHFSVRY